ncbi:MAG TPA: hypothetical protein VL179_09565 [Mycobacterium sp.]|nr:hypothetical protein [Mycobacterium sp.]
MTAVGGSIVDSVLSGISSAIGGGIKAMVATLASWIYIPSDPVCPVAVPSGSGVVSGDWVTACQHATSPATTLGGYVLPVTILVAVFGVIWQGILMAVTRKSEPLLQVIRGLWNSALWGAVGIAGTQLALHASDSFADWVISTALNTGNPGPGPNTFTAALSAMLFVGLPAEVILEIVVGIVIIIVVLIQIVLMIFRDAAIAILAGMLQLAAAGSFTKATSPWMPKITGWMGALIVYKPAAALCYAAGLAFMTDHSSSANFVIGIAVLALSVVALPALMKFFTWTVGSIQSGSSLGMFGAGAAAGMHAAASMRGLGGNSAADHSRYMSDNGPGSRPGTGAGPSGSEAPGTPPGPRPGSGPSSAPAPKVIDGEVISSGPASAGASATPTTTVPAGTGATASSGAAGASAAGGGAAGGAAAGGAAGAGATGGAGAGAAGAAGAGAAAASGPAAPVVLGVVVAAQAATKAAKAAADSASDSTGGA